MRFTLLLFACSAIIISSCKKEKENIDTRPEVRLSKIITYGEDRLRELSLEYNESGFIEEITDRTKYFNSTNAEYVRKIVYTYDLRNLITEEQITDPATGAFTGIYEYNEQNRLDKVKYTLYGTPESSYVQYTWDNNDVLQTVDIRGLGNSRFQEIFYDTRGNVTDIKGQYSSIANDYYYSNVKCDDHPNYMSTIKGLNNYVYFFGVGPQTLSKNNVLSYDWKISTAVYDYGSYIYKLSYNHYGYVEKAENMKTAEVSEFYYEIVP